MEAALSACVRKDSDARKYPLSHTDTAYSISTVASDTLSLWSSMSYILGHHAAVEMNRSMSPRRCSPGHAAVQQQMKSEMAGMSPEKQNSD